MDIFNLEPILSVVNEPQDKKKFNIWVQQKDVLRFLEQEIQDEHIIIYASLPNFFIHAVLIPRVELDETSIQRLLKWDNQSPYSSWGLCSSSDDVWIEAPLENSESELLSKGEQIIFARSFEGDKSRGTYYELEQKIAQILGIHFMSERNAWCKLDSSGDIEDIVKISRIDNSDRRESRVLISMKRQILAEYAGLNDVHLLRMFDFMRYKKRTFSGWNKRDRYESSLESFQNIFGELVVYPGYGSYSRGIQIADIGITREEIHRRFWNGARSDREKKKYATFTAYDWKHHVIKEISCDPSCLSNYFTKSDLPFEITPAFFKPEVLLKYKSDREKYQLRSRSVSCRGSWHLKTFDINAANQVHTYLIYLSHLPYEEQLRWKEYNEKPKAPISKRALTTDFLGKFYSGYDSLLSLKNKLEKLDKSNIGWWKLRDQNAPEKVHYPYTSSKEEWADEILNIDQLLVEGFEEKWLRRKAKSMGRNPDMKSRSLKLIEECLIGIGFGEDQAEKIASPFHKVHNLRSKLKGHVPGQEAETIRKTALTDFGSFRKHFEYICAECDESLGTLIEAFKDFD